MRCTVSKRSREITSSVLKPFNTAVQYGDRTLHLSLRVLNYIQNGKQQCPNCAVGTPGATRTGPYKPRICSLAPNFNIIIRSANISYYVLCEAGSWFNCATNSTPLPSTNCIYENSLPSTPVAQWLRYCATNRKVAGSIPAGVNGFFIDMKFFRSHYGPGVDSASNRNEYHECFLRGKGGRCVRLTTLPLSCALVTKSGSLNFLEPSGPVQVCNWTALPFTLHSSQCVKKDKPKKLMKFLLADQRSHKHQFRLPNLTSFTLRF